jgi:hypothetical protein
MNLVVKVATIWSWKKNFSGLREENRRLQLSLKELDLSQEADRQHRARLEQLTEKLVPEINISQLISGLIIMILKYFRKKMDVYMSRNTFNFGLKLIIKLVFKKNANLLPKYDENSVHNIAPWSGVRRHPSSVGLCTLGLGSIS